MFAFEYIKWIKKIYTEILIVTTYPNGGKEENGAGTETQCVCVCTRV